MPWRRSSHLLLPVVAKLASKLEPVCHLLEMELTQDTGRNFDLGGVGNRRLGWQTGGAGDWLHKMFGMFP